MKFYIKAMAVFLILSLIAVPLFTGCNRGEDNGDGDETTEEAAPPEEPKPHKVGFVYRGAVENSTHNLLWENARSQLERNLGVETCYVEDVFVQNFREAVELLVSHDVTVVVSTSHSFENAVRSVALDYKDIDFISLGGEGTLSNLTIFNPLLYQPANVCGLAAAFNAVSPVIGIVADARMYNCAGVINAYIQGKKEYLTTRVETRINYVSSTNETEVKRAIDDLVEQGHDVIMLYMSTDYGIKYCEEIGVRVIAYAGNLPELAPNNYITGFYFNVDSYLTEQVRFIQNNSFQPTTRYGGLDSGHARMIRLNPDETIVDPVTERLTNALYKGIVEHDMVFMGEIIDNQGQLQVESGVVLTQKEALTIAWLDFSVREHPTRFSDPVEHPAIVPLVVRGEWDKSVVSSAPDDEQSTEEPPSTATTVATTAATTAAETTTAEPDETTTQAA